MTYPHPSRGYQELVCTAGITRSLDWVRLYPIDYRYRAKSQQFHKYQWINVGLASRGAGNDNRCESRRPDLDSIRILGPPLSSGDGWRERREIIEKMPIRTVNQLRGLYDSDRISIGIVRPTEMLDLEIEPADPEWKPEWQALFSQLTLFGDAPKDLAKIPFKFSYVFRCEDSVNPHRTMIEDWELGVLYLKERERKADEKLAAQSVKDKYLVWMFSKDRDPLLFMGTTFPYNAWVVIGVFYPPKQCQGVLDFGS
ncbi:MAG: hypothetical protein IT158_30755 [Bryobacterales bacterium]|nr:hypothetical protein [Bryobacterales bacterium]